MSGPVLVTGASGFAGSHLIERLAGATNLAAWARSEPPREIAAFATWRRVDLLDRDQVRQAIRDLKPSAVYHCAGAPHVAESWQNATRPLEENVLATHYLLDALRRAGARCRVLVPGSAHVYVPSRSPLTEGAALGPSSPYALSKLAQEQLGLHAAREDGLEVVVTRSFNHTGPRQKADFFAPAMARQIALIERREVEAVIRVGNLDAERDLTDVRDIVRAYTLLMEKGTPGTVYNVSSGVSRPVRVVLEELVRRSRVPVQIETDRARLRPQDIPVLVGDSSRLREATGWAPEIPFERMLDDLLNYWREHGTGRASF